MCVHIQYIMYTVYMSVCMYLFPTSVADHTHRRRREDEDTSTQQGQFPKHHDLLTKEANELGHTASRVCDLVHRCSQRRGGASELVNLGFKCKKESGKRDGTFVPTFISGCMPLFIAAPQAMVGHTLITPSPLGGRRALLSS